MPREHGGECAVLTPGDYEYAPTSRGFTTVDPLPGVAATTTVANPYHYANNDPLNQIDPLGLRPLNDSDMRLISSSCPAPGGTATGTTIGCQ